MVFCNQRLKLHNNVPNHIFLSRQKILKNNGRILVEIDIMSGF